MSTTAVPSVAAPAARANRASFAGLLRAELFKLAHLRIARVLAALYLLFVVGGQLLLASGANVGASLRDDPLGSFRNVFQGDLSILRILVGIVILILSAHAVGLEYSQGTIRILLGRGVGRLQLLAAKMLALAVVALALVAAGLLIELLGAWLIVVANAGSQHPWTALNGEFWTDVWFYLLTVVISAGATLLLGVAASVAGRSLAFGLAVGLGWFAVDNMLLIPLSLLARFTHSTFWLNVGSYLLGPVLNRLPDHLVPAWHTVIQGPHGPVTVAHTTDGFGPIPPAAFDARHALAVVAVYSAIFVAVSIILTHRRDILE